MAGVWAEGESYKTGSASKKANMEVYAEWLSLPKDERKPATKKELAKSLDVTVQTLANYEKESWLQREVLKRSRGLFKVERAQDIVNALYEIAMNVEKGSAAVSAARLLLDYIAQDYQPEEEEGLSKYSDEDLVKTLMDRGNIGNSGTG